MERHPASATLLLIPQCWFSQASAYPDICGRGRGRPCHCCHQSQHHPPGASLRTGRPRPRSPWPGTCFTVERKDNCMGGWREETESLESEDHDRVLRDAEVGATDVTLQKW